MKSHQIKLFEVASGRINRAAGIIAGCSVITTGEALGHNMRIDATTLAQVVEQGNSFVGGVRVRFADEDHTGGAATIVGTLRQFRIDGNQVRADLHLLKKSPAFDRILEMAAEIPDQFGLSIVFSGVHEMDTETDKALARCAELYGVDIVAMPAANPSGLFTAQVDTAPKDNDMAKTLTEQVKELSEQVTSLSVELTGAKEREANTAQDCANALEQGKLVTAKVVELEAELSAKATAILDRDAQIAQLRQEIADAQVAAGKQAQAALAAIGVPPVAADTEPTSAKDLSKLSIGELVAMKMKITDSTEAAKFHAQWISPKLNPTK